jgi:hypothetical protein
VLAGDREFVHGSASLGGGEDLDGVAVAERAVPFGAGDDLPVDGDGGAAGEILLNSIDADGTKAGFDLPLIAAVRAAVDIPVIASGGAGKAADFPPAVEAGADAVLAASIFHFGEVTIAEVKSALDDAGHPVR